MNNKYKEGNMNAPNYILNQHKPEVFKQYYPVFKVLAEDIPLFVDNSPLIIGNICCIEDIKALNPVKSIITLSLIGTSYKYYKQYNFIQRTIAKIFRLYLK